MSVKNFKSFNESKVEDKAILEIWNTYMDFVSGLDGIYSETGEMLPSFIDESLVEEMNKLTMPDESIDLKYIYKNEKRIKENASKLVEAVKAAIDSGKISEDRYFQVGNINKLKSLLSKDVVGLKK